jgi:hypothetical protein
MQVMLELTFKLTTGDDAPRDVVVRIHQPFRSAPNEKWPWSITVDVDGRPSTTYGTDPLDAVENGAQHAARLVRIMHEDSLDPPIEPRK